MKLLNVRLAPEDARMAARRRQASIPISRLVREAIHAADARHATARASHRRPSEIMADIYRENPATVKTVKRKITEHHLLESRLLRSC